MNAVGLEPSKLLTISVQLFCITLDFFQQHRKKNKKHFYFDLAHVHVWVYVCSAHHSTQLSLSRGSVKVDAEAIHG